MKLFLAVLILFLLFFAALAWSLRRRRHQRRAHPGCACDSAASEHSGDMRINVRLPGEHNFHGQEQAESDCQTTPQQKSR